MERSVCLSPKRLVDRFALLLCNELKRHAVSIDMIVEPCAGDGRLGKTVHSNIPGSEYALFDLSPRDQDVEKGNILDDCFVRSLNERRSFATKKNVLVLNPPFRPEVTFEAICKAALAIPGLDTCGLVLPGLFLDFERLDKLLPCWWHPLVVERVSGLNFEQPDLQSAAAEITVAVVIARRRSYPRPAWLGTCEVAPCGFEYVPCKSGEWHQAFEFGGVRRPIQVRNSGQDLPESGSWLFVRYNNYTNEAHLKMICDIVQCRTSFLTGVEGDRERRTMFPTIGTAGRFYVPKHVVTQWINHVLRDDTFFFQASNACKVAQILLHNAAVADTVETAKKEGSLGQFVDDVLEAVPAKMQDMFRERLLVLAGEVCNEIRRDEGSGIAEQLLCGVDGPSKEDMFELKSWNGNVPTKLKWWMDLAKVCKERATNNLGDKSVFEHKLTAVAKNCDALRSLMDKCNLCASTETKEAHRDVVQAVLDLQMSDANVAKRGSDVAFCGRLLIGREVIILKSNYNLTWEKMALLWKKSHEKMDAKTLERHAIVHNRVVENSLLRFAWSGFDKLAKNASEFREAVEKYGLDFGGPAPIEEIVVNNNKVVSVLPVWFCMLLNEPKDENPDEICIICQETMTEAVQVIGLQCQHIFCLGCLQQWTSGQGVSCPLCREEIAAVKKLSDGEILSLQPLELFSDEENEGDEEFVEPEARPKRHRSR